MEMAVIAMIALGIATPVLGYYAWMNIRQGQILSNPLRLSQLPDHIGEVVVVYGEPEPEEEVKMRLLRRPREQVLWLKIEKQEKVQSGRSSYWRTVQKKERKTDFNLLFKDGGQVYVYCDPSEVQSSSRNVSGGGYSHGSQRTVQTWLPLVSRLTVMGKLVHEEEGAAIVPDKTHGLFLSPHSPQRAAKKELLKGYGALAGGAACLIALAVMAAMML